MRRVEVVVNSLALWECCQTYPAYVRVTTSACHMITAFRPLDRRFATRATFDFVRTDVLIESAVNLMLAVVASDSLVIFDVAVWANAH